MIASFNKWDIWGILKRGNWKGPDGLEEHPFLLLNQELKPFI